MDWSRREWLSLGATAGSLAFLAKAAPAPASYFALHPFLEAHPKSVFIRRTRVQDKMDRKAKLAEGLQLARQIFVPADRPGIPVSHRIVLKPNSTTVINERPDVENWGTGTDPDFYEGLVMGLKELGLTKFHFLEANLYPTWNVRGFVDINQRHGVAMNETERRPRHFAEGVDMSWSKVPDAVVYSRIPHYAPLNEQDTWLLNIAKWKSHGMCLTLSVKNEQGLVVSPYVRFCAGLSMVTGVPEFMKADICADSETRLRRYFENHGRMGYARYDGRRTRWARGVTPFDMEIWAHKTCDNQSVVRTGLAMIEGITARDGDGFGIGDDHLTNLVLFGKDKFRLDLVGLWLGGHEPGNVSLCRVAKERGLTDTFNPWDVEVFEWTDSGPVRSKMTDFPRANLKTCYLQRDDEPTYHMVDEPFDYEKVKM